MLFVEFEAYTIFCFIVCIFKLCVVRFGLYCNYGTYVKPGHSTGCISELHWGIGHVYAQREIRPITISLFVFEISSMWTKIS